MTQRCSHCGFRSTDAEFFRREKGGLLNRPQTICDACTSYKPTPYERRMGLRVLMAPLAFILGVSPLLSHDIGVFAFMLIMALTSVPTLPLRILIHEAGHAFAARLVGQVVWQARIGSGPIRHRLKAGGVVFEIRAIPWTGGLVKFFGPAHPAGRASQAFIIAAGPAANLLTAIVALGLSNLCQGVGAIAAAFAGFGIFSLIVGLYNLIPRRFGDNETVSSDGRQLLNLLKPRPTPDPMVRQVRRVAGYSYMRQYAAALTAALEDWQASRYRFLLAALILHNLSRDQGDRAALGFFLMHEVELRVGEDVNAGDKESLAWVWAYVAWSVLKLDDAAFAELAARAAAAAIEALPDKPEIQATYNAWLVSVGRAEEGLSRLVRATREIDDTLDKAEFCDFLSRTLRQRGNPRRAATYDALQIHLRARASCV